MKVNTNDTVLLSPSIRLRPNRSILDKNLSSGIEKKDNGEMGRQVNYEPTMILTPVLTSARTERNTPNRPRLDKNAVDEVCTMLSTLFVRESTKEHAKSEIKSEGKNETQGKVKEAQVKDELGRVKISILNSRAESSVVVHRSARLAAVCKG